MCRLVTHSLFWVTQTLIILLPKSKDKFWQNLGLTKAKAKIQILFNPFLITRKLTQICWGLLVNEENCIQIFIQEGFLE